MSYAALLIGTICMTFLTGCGTTCTGVGANGIDVRVVDSLSQAPAGDGATLLIYGLDRGGVRTDSMTGRAAIEHLVGAADRTGRYSVVVRKAGYRDWTVPEVTVRDGCPSIVTVYLTAQLARP